MAQVKVYGLREQLNPVKARLSDLIHGCVVEALGLPPEKRFHRFFPMEREDFLFPPDRSDRYTILEISLFEGRTPDTRKRLIRLLYDRLGAELQLSPMDLEITLFETPKRNWGIRGVSGDELSLDYKVEA
ncbi:MAG: tautomerase family protein [Armatimonadetes bacterium]|nr:tautomerase family protein [Armatimonadota bacterium]